MPIKKIGLISSFVVTVVIFGIIFRLFTHQLACEGQPVNDNLPPTPTQQILGDRIIGQSFVSPRDNLNRIDIFFQTYGRQNTHDVSLRLFEPSLAQANLLEGTEIFQSTFSAKAIWDQSWHSFFFPQISDSAGKSYFIALQSLDSEDGNAITIGGIQQNVYLPGNAFVYAPDLGFPQLTAVPGDMMFRACYQMSSIEKLQVFLKQLSKDRPAIWGNNIFYVISFVAYFLVLVTLMWYLFTLGRSHK